MFHKAQKDSQQLLKDFIKCYQSEPCLWDTKSKLYHDKVRKHAAYAKLLRIYKFIDTRADRITVVKKINILRTSHRKEKKKVEASKRSGNGKYVPKLWYYHLFDFLEKHKYTTTIQEELNEKDDGCVEQIEVYVDETSASQDSHSSLFTSHEGRFSGTLPELTTAASVQNCNSPVTSLDQQIPSKTSQINPSKRISPDGIDDSYREQENDSKKPKWGDDRYELFAANVIFKMKDIQNNTQRLLAEKIINETLFMAEMGQLSLSHSVNVSRNYFNPQPIVYNAGKSDLANTIQQTSIVALKKEIPSPDCTSCYEKEDNQSFSCGTCGRPNRSSYEEDEYLNDPLLNPK